MKALDESFHVIPVSAANAISCKSYARNTDLDPPPFRKSQSKKRPRIDSPSRTRSNGPGLRERFFFQVLGVWFIALTLTLTLPAHLSDSGPPQVLARSGPPGARDQDPPVRIHLNSVCHTETHIKDPARTRTGSKPGTGTGSGPETGPVRSGTTHLMLVWGLFLLEVRVPH